LTMEDWSESIDTLEKAIKPKSEFLTNLIKGRILPSVYLGDTLRFVVARQWNSWYPSYFTSEGGCYAFITRDKDEKALAKKKNAGVIVIDPGFGFLTALRKKFHIEPQDIRQIIVTHFHPDHMAGLIEFATLTHESEFPCEVYLNETSYSFFKAFHGKNFHVNEIRPRQVVKLFHYNYKGKEESAFLRIIQTHHCEIGQKHCALGLIITLKRNGFKDCKLGILGDTDGNESYIKQYVNDFSDVDVLVLHLGTLVDKDFGRGDKHLYAEGVRSILKEFESRIAEKKPKLILLSEFGLELGSNKEIIKLLDPISKSYGFLVLLLAYKYFKISDKEIVEKEIFANSLYKIVSDFIQNKDIVSEFEIERLLSSFAIFIIALNESLSSKKIIDTLNQDPKENISEFKLNKKVINIECYEKLNNGLTSFLDHLIEYSGIKSKDIFYAMHSLSEIVYREAVGRVKKRLSAETSFPSIIKSVKHFSELISIIEKATEKDKILNPREYLWISIIGAKVMYEITKESTNRDHEEIEIVDVLEEISMIFKDYIEPTYEFTHSNAGSQVIFFRKYLGEDKIQYIDDRGKIIYI
jgi:ribonuclease BN (tRNA processing enzyme)